MHRVKIEADGAILIDGHYRGLIDRSEHGWARVFLLPNEGAAVKVAEFRHFRPYMAARSWVRFVLRRKTVAQVMHMLRYRNGHEVAVRMGWKSPAEIEASGATKPFRSTGKHMS